MKPEQYEKIVDEVNARLFAHQPSPEEAAARVARGERVMLDTYLAHYHEKLPQPILGYTDVVVLKCERCDRCVMVPVDPTTKDAIDSFSASIAFTIFHHQHIHVGGTA